MRSITVSHNTKYFNSKLYLNDVKGVFFVHFSNNEEDRLLSFCEIMKSLA